LPGAALQAGLVSQCRARIRFDTEPTLRSRRALFRLGLLATSLPEARARVLVVEDDTRLGASMCEYLISHGLGAVLEPRGDAAVLRILDGAWDLVVLDLLLPGLDGLEVCRRVRARFHGGILILTARAEEVDEIVGLEVGADDYLPKPVRPRLLLAHLEALLRRVRGPRNGHAPPEPPATISVGALAIDSRARSVRMHGRPVELTTAEFELLWLLASRAGEVVTRDEIYRTLRGIEYDGLDRAIDLRVARLRRKIGDDAKQPLLLKSVRGVGYLMAPEAP
jgi:two-component system, OmpR family, response regulator RstA